VAKVDVVAEQKDKQQFADIFLLLIAIQSLVTLTIIGTQTRQDYTNIMSADEYKLNEGVFQS